MRAPLVVALATLIAVVVAGCGIAARAHRTVALHVGATSSGSIGVSGAVTGPAVPTGFVGISMEYKGLEAYTGSDVATPDQGFLQLLRNLAPTGGAVLRIGGDSSDWTWWPSPGVAKPAGVKLSLTPNWAGVARTVATDIKGRLILGVNFEADNATLAADEERELLSHVGLSQIDAFELGNEPELYASFPWFKTASGQRVYGRRPGYDVADYLSEFQHIAATLPKAPLAGPSSGSATWLASLGSFATDEHQVSLLTVHAYPTKNCIGKNPVTDALLFAPASLSGLAAQIGSWVTTATAHHLPLRVDEMNSVSCGGQKGITNAFAPALWALNLLPRLVSAGVTGVNFHTEPGTIQALLSARDASTGWRVSTQPEYLGLLAFVQAAPAGSHLLTLSTPSLPGIDVWGTKAANGQLHIVVINESTTSRTLTLSGAGLPSGATVTEARLAASSLAATTATLDGQSISPTTGALAGTPAITTLPASRGQYQLTAPAASATIVTVSAGASKASSTTKTSTTSTGTTSTNTTSTGTVSITTPASPPTKTTPPASTES